MPPSRWPARRSTASSSTCRAAIAASRIVKTEIAVGRREISDADMRQVLERGYAMRDAPRSPGHPLDPGRLLDRRQPRHPRSARHVRRAARRQHAHRDRRDRQRAQPHRRARTLRISKPRRWSSALTPRVSPVSSRTRWISASRSIDMGGGTTTIGVFFDGNLIFADCVPVGGMHVTNDIARGLSTPLAHAERHEDAVRQRDLIDARRARDDRRAADRRGRRRPGQSRAEIAARRHHRAAARGDLRAGAQPARRERHATRSPAAASC